MIEFRSANGGTEPSVIQRIFWALKEGAKATVLLIVKGEEGPVSSQSMSIASGRVPDVI